MEGWLRRAVVALGMLAMGAWLGFIVHVRHPSLEHALDARDLARAAQPAGLRAPTRKTRQSANDDLDSSAKTRVLHEYAPSDPLAIRPGDWSSGRRFSRPAPEQLGASGATYPATRPLAELLGAWNPDNVSIPLPFAESLQVFNFSDAAERAMAVTYRNAELPFKIYDVPDVEAVRATWTDAYLVDTIDNHRQESFKIEKSNNNHFMYWRHVDRVKKSYADWEPPTEIVTGHKFADWLEWARQADAEETGPEVPHHYLMMGTSPLSQVNRGSGRARSFITRDLPMFVPHEENFFVTDTHQNKGIQCRFGMRGVIAEAHYDGGRNMVAMLKGAKRYVLTPPESCKTLKLIPDRRHPSFRHSDIDWSHPDTITDHFGPRSADARAIDTVVREGEVLYIPSFWIHYIISLKYSIQCNTRSGSPPKQQGQDVITACLGALVPPEDAELSKKKKKKRH